MNTRVLLCVVTLAIATVWCHTALGLDPVPAISLGAGDVLSVNTMGGKALGWEFTLNSPVYVTHLGVFDDVVMGSAYAAGFTSDYQIGIYRTSDGASVAYAELSAGDPIQLEGNGYTYNSPYWYVPLAEPVTLASLDGDGNPVHYVVACWTAGLVDYHIEYLNTMTANAAVNPVSHLVIAPDIYGYGLISPGWPTGLVLPTGLSRSDLFTPSFMFTLEPPAPTVTQVNLDIWPGTNFNCIDLRFNYFVPAAILSDADFDATTVDPTTIDLAGAGVAVWGWCATPLYAIFDVDCDGDNDLVFLVKSKDIDPALIVGGYAILTAKTYAGDDLEGKDQVTIIQ